MVGNVLKVQMPNSIGSVNQTKQRASVNSGIKSNCKGEGRGESVPSSFVKRRRCLEVLCVPRPVCDGAEVALHDAGQELVPVMLRHGAPTVVDDRDKAEQQGGQGAAAAQQLQPPVAREALALQGAAPGRAAGQHGTE